MNMTLQAARQQAHQSGDGSALVSLVPYAVYLGVQLRVDAATGAASPEPGFHASFRLPFRLDLVGRPSPPAFHGGVIAGFMENAALLHVLLMSGQQRIPKSVDFSIDYLHSARVHDLLAQCAIERIGRRVAQVQIRCTQVSADAHYETGHPPSERALDPDRSIAVARAHFLLSDAE